MSEETSCRDTAAATGKFGLDQRTLRWGGDDVDHFIYALRWLGAEEEAGAAETERVLRELVQRECGDNFRHLKWPAR